MKYLAIDPSFSRTGIAILDTETRSIKLKPVSPVGTNDSYTNTVERSAYIIAEVLKEFKVSDNISVIIEEPMVRSLKASALGILSGVSVTTLLLLPIINEIRTVNPITIKSLNSVLPYKNKLSKKQLSLHVAEELIEFYKSIGHTVELVPLKYNKNGSPRSRALTHDEAESLILLTVLLLDRGYFKDMETLSIYQINKGFLTKKIIVNKLK